MEVVYSRSIIKDVKKLKDTKIICLIESLINDFKSTSDISEIKDIVKMKGYSDAYRIKIKDYRLGFYLKRSIVVLAVFKKREDIYKVFP